MNLTMTVGQAAWRL